MRTRIPNLLLATAAVFALAACGSDDNTPPDADADTIVDTADNCPAIANTNQVDSDLDGAGDACDAIPTTYAYTNSANADSVSYTGQTKRHLLISDMTTEIKNVTEDPAVDVAAKLNFYFRYDGSTSDTVVAKLDIGETLLPNNGTALTYGSVSSGKNLVGKIAGGDGIGGGETTRLIGDEFFGWTTGMDASPLPVEMVDYLITQINSIATDNVTPQIATSAGNVALDTVTTSATGVDYRQLMQKFLLMGVTFSEGTNDYFKTDFANALAAEGTKPYSAAEHDWDEAFGYFGAVRNYGDFTDEEISGKGGRDAFKSSFNDANSDGSIDIRSELNFGNAVNCGKRDRGSAGNANPTDFTKTAFDAFLLGRELVKNATAAGTMSAAAQTALDAQITIAAQTWEKCIAATVVHYINDLTADLNSYDGTNFADLANFKNVAKHWSEMKGFALGLQFSSYSPFRADATTLGNLKTLLGLLGDAPVLADGNQGGSAFAGGVTQYKTDLMTARDMLQTAYGFDASNVQNW